MVGDVQWGHLMTHEVKEPKRKNKGKKTLSHQAEIIFRPLEMAIHLITN